MWRKGNSFALFVGIQIGADTVESNMETPQKIKNGSAFLPSDPTSGNISKKTQNTNLINTLMFFAALFTIAKIRKQIKCPSVDEWIKQLWYIYTMEYYLSVKRKEILPFAVTCMDLVNIMLSEISQSERNKYHIMNIGCGI